MKEIVLTKLSVFGSCIPNLSAFGSVDSFEQACTAKEADAIGSALKQSITDVRGGEVTIARVVERIGACSLLKTKRGPEIDEAIVKSM